MKDMPRVATFLKNFMMPPDAQSVDVAIEPPKKTKVCVTRIVEVFRAKAYNYCAKISIGGFVNNKKCVYIYIN